MNGYELPTDEQMARVKPQIRSFFKAESLRSGLWLAASSCTTVLMPWCLVHVVDDGIAAASMTALFSWLAAAALAQASGGLFRYIGECSIVRQALVLEKTRLMHLFEKTMHSDLTRLPEYAQGSMMGQILFASGSERRFLEVLYNQGIPLCITAAGTFSALILLSWQLTALSILLCPLAFGLWVWMRKKIRPATKSEFEAHEGLYRRIVDIFRAMFSIRAMHQEDRFIQSFEKTSQKCVDAGYELERNMAVQGPYFDVIQAIVLVIIFGAGGYAVLNESMTIGGLLGFQVYLARLFGLMRSGTGIFGAWQQYIEGRARSADIESLPASQPVSFKCAQNNEILRIDSLSFRFDDNWIWRDYSLCIHAGEKKAILLPSGSGKTTLARCILGLYAVESGAISLPDADVRCIGFVPQENVLFDGTMRENISMMVDAVSDEYYRELLFLCGLETLSARLGNERIGDQGSRLSGGEQRRVMLARALASCPKLLIIDQMASELEPELCSLIFARIQKSRPDMGILYLGHRMPEWN